MSRTTVMDAAREADDLVVPAPAWTQLLCGIVGLVMFAAMCAVWAAH